MIWAALSGKVQPVITLIKHGADIEARSDLGFTALNAAASAGFADVVRVLVAHGADTLAMENQGYQALANAEFNEVSQNKSKLTYDATTGLTSEDSAGDCFANDGCQTDFS